MKYVVYLGDIESTGLDSIKNDVIELSLLRLNDGEQKTWCLKPFNLDGIEPGALRVNGHKLDDLLHKTKEGKEKYLDPIKTIIEIENWIMEDNVTTENRILCGHNCFFDRDMLEQLWKKCNSKDSFPFGRRVLDTLMIEFFMDFCKDSFAEGYSLNNLVKKYGIKNEKAHTAAADTLATKEVFVQQVAFFKKALMS